MNCCDEYGHCRFDESCPVRPVTPLDDDEFSDLHRALIASARRDGVRKILDAANAFAAALGIDGRSVRAGLLGLLEEIALAEDDDDVLDDLYSNED